MFFKRSVHLTVLILLTLLSLGTSLINVAAQEGTGDHVAVCPKTADGWLSEAGSWPVTTLQLGSQFYNEAELTAILSMDAGDDASITLAQQLIATKLSLAGGAEATVIAALMGEADALLATYAGKLPYSVSVGSDEGADMVVLASTFDVYNIGTFIEDCDDDLDDDDAESTPEPEMTPDPDGDDDDHDGIIIVIEGPVESVDVNIVVIYGINIVLEADDPALTVIQIGDVIRVTGELLDDDDDDILLLLGDNDDEFGITIVIVAVQIVFVNVEVYVLDGQVWRDEGSCRNAPPPWAPANGWRRRCDPGGNGSGSGSRS